MPKIATHHIKTRDGRGKTLKYGRAMAIKLFCVECLGWEDDPKDCTAPECPLYPFRGRTLMSKHGDKSSPVAPKNEAS